MLVHLVHREHTLSLLGMQVFIQSAAIPAGPPSRVITVSDDLAFRKLRCENTP
jgi:hypothetical protein